MQQVKQVGGLCPDCGTPYIDGKKGPYCKKCYIAWANANKSKPAASGRDFEAEARGKVRHGLICAFIQGKTAEELLAQMADFKTRLLLPLEELIMGKPKTPQEVPTIQVEEAGIDMSDIPF
jgi:hypothetical protein